MIQSGHLRKDEKINREKFIALTAEAVEKLDVDQARKEVEPFVKILKRWRSGRKNSLMMS